MNSITADTLWGMTQDAYQTGLNLQAAEDAANGRGDGAAAAQCNQARADLHVSMEQLWVANRDKLLSSGYAQPIADSLHDAVDATAQAARDLAQLANALAAVSRVIGLITDFLKLIS